MAFRRTPKYVVDWTPRGYVFNIQEEELELVVRLFAELRALVLSDDPQHAPLMRRLFPPAYHLSDDAEAESEYQRLMREELVASRLESLGAVEKAMSVGAPLDDAAMEGFVRSLNSVRLVLGTLLDVGEAHDPTAVRDDDPMVGEHHLYTFLSWLLECAVDAINRSGTSRS